jgi:hypothetical protein
MAITNNSTFFLEMKLLLFQTAQDPMLAMLEWMTGQSSWSLKSHRNAMHPRVPMKRQGLHTAGGIAPVDSVPGLEHGTCWFPS